MKKKGNIFKKTLSKLDKPLLIGIMIFFIFGSLMILSASSMESYMRYENSPYFYFRKEVIFLVIGFVIFFFLLFIPTCKYKKINNFFLFLSFISLILIFEYGYGVNGALSWYKFNFFGKTLTIQPSEFTKIFLIIYFACFFNKYKDKLEENYNAFKPFLFLFFFIGLIFLQPDFGTSLIIVMICLMIFYAVPTSKNVKKHFNIVLFVVISFFLILVFIAGNKFLEGYQLERFNYFNPCDRYQEKSGYQLCNSFIAFKNGGLKGQGPGKSTQKYLYLSEAYTDFIFAIVVEEGGIILGVLVLVGYMFVLLRIIKIARRSYNLQNGLICYGVFSYMILHIMINLLGIMGVIPLTGVPLPFLSYGGSYTLSLLMALGIVERIAIENNRMLDKLKKG